MLDIAFVGGTLQGIVDISFVLVYSVEVTCPRLKCCGLLLLLWVVGFGNYVDLEWFICSTMHYSLLTFH